MQAVRTAAAAPVGYDPPPMTRPSPRPSATLLFGALLLGLAGCSARMVLDPKLAASAPETPVSGVAFAQFRKPVVFGPYTATLTRGGFTRTSSTNLGPYQRQTTKKNFEFTLQGGAPASWQGKCSYGASEQAVLFPISDDAGFVCTLVPDGAAGWQLQLASQGKLLKANTLTGTMTDGTTTLKIAMVHRLEQAAFASAGPVGYEFRDASGAAVAAVQVFNPQKVWIDPSLPPALQTAIAAGAVGLLVSADAAASINE